MNLSSAAAEPGIGATQIIRTGFTPGMVHGKVLQVVLDIVVKKDALFLYQHIACILEENHFICTCASFVHLGKPSFKKYRNFLKLFHKRGGRVNRISYLLFRNSEYPKIIGKI